MSQLAPYNVNVSPRPLSSASRKQDMLAAMDKLPKGTETCVVEGGNHGGFASYARQFLDWEVSKDKGENSQTTRI